MILRAQYIIGLVLIFISVPSFGQFYNGMQMNFGKNRVQYEDTYWQYLRYQDFDVYYDKEGRELADYVVKNIPVIQKQVEDVLDLGYPRRIIFVVCNTLEDLKQTNIGLSSSEEHYNVGGVSQIIDNKILLYFNGNHNQLLMQMREGFASLLINEFIYGAENYREIISNSALIDYPAWFVDGLISYMSNDWNGEIEGQVREILAANKFKNLIHLQENDAIFAGHALWRYIAEAYGKEKIGSILYLSGVTNDLNSSFVFILGKELPQIISEMQLYYTQRTSSERLISIQGEKIKLPRRLAKRPITHFAVDPTGKNIVYVTEKRGRQDLWLQSLSKKQPKHIMKFGHAIQLISDDSFPCVDWHPNSASFSFFYEFHGKLYFNRHILETKEDIEIDFNDFEKILSFDYAQDGYTIVFSGVKRGQSDIYTFDTRTYAKHQITNNIADDLNPRFIDNDERIIFASNSFESEQLQGKDTLQVNFDLYTIGREKHSQAKPILSTKYDNEMVSHEYEKGKYIYASNKSGISNLYYTKTDSLVNSIDTVVHYKYFSESFPLTTYSDNILQFSVSPKSNYIYMYTFKNKRSYLYKHNIDSLFNSINTENEYTYYKVKKDSIYKQLINSLEGQNHLINPSAPNMPVDYKAYKFDYELYPYSSFVDSVLFSDTVLTRYKSALPYRTNFYVNQVVNQVDFGYANSAYQKFTGNEFYYAPRLNVFLKFGVIDLFEDYRLTGGVRLFGDFNSNEYLLSLENLKKRWDKQYIFHRQSVIKSKDMYGYEWANTYDHLLMAEFKYPFDEVKSFRITPSLRYVKEVELSTGSLLSLLQESQKDYWVGVKTEYVFDNIMPQALNIYYGSRLKLFAEFYQKLNNKDNSLFVTGFDARHYQKIHRTLILAGRLAYSYSQGKSPLLYYMGGLDNWVSIYSKFHDNIEYDKTQDWAYQAIATNMRGFRQNIRNGPSFIVANVELRFPIFSYFANRPIHSDILSNMQIIGFFDAGGAWNGLIPGKKENAYNYTIVGESVNSHVSVKIDEMRQPFVYGYGYGLRTRLFGYFVRADWATGVDEGKVSNMFYLSLSLDF